MAPFFFAQVHGIFSKKIIRLLLQYTRQACNHAAQMPQRANLKRPYSPPATGVWLG